MYTKYLVIGATGGSGKELVHELLKQGHEVRIIVRSRARTVKALGDITDKLQIIECELGDDKANTNDGVREAVRWCDVLVSCLGSTVNSTHVQQSNYTAVVELIKLCEEIKVDDLEDFKFVLMTSMFITRPYSIRAIVLNIVKPYVFGWKALAENKLRQSKLKYIIIRPGSLNNKDEPHNVVLTQGDKLNWGRISRKNLAVAIISSLSDRNVSLDRVTFEIVEDSSRVSQEGISLKYDTILPDNEKSIITSDHFTATKNIKAILFTGLFLLISWLIWKNK
jgi:NAD(P)-dependent dehydrogenase (short-subunit alcohol dehydrogenase family)